MAIEQVTASQIKATGTPSSTTFLRGDGTWNSPTGAAVQTQWIATTGGTGAKTTTATPFIIGNIMVETTDSNTNAVNVFSTLTGSMRNYTSKTSDVTNRIIRGVSGAGQCHMTVTRGTSGTVLTLNNIDQGADFNSSGVSIGSINNQNWPNPGYIRITMWEDTQS